MGDTNLPKFIKTDSLGCQGMACEISNYLKIPIEAPVVHLIPCSFRKARLHGIFCIKSLSNASFPTGRFALSCRPIWHIRANIEAGHQQCKQYFLKKTDIKNQLHVSWNSSGLIPSLISHQTGHFRHTESGLHTNPILQSLNLSKCNPKTPSHE